MEGDCREMLKTIPEKSVRTCVTSPPYFGLRDYGTATWDGGDHACDHTERSAQTVNLANSVHSTRGGAKKIAETPTIQYRDTCGKCGATRVDAQIGLESSVADYVQAMVEVFRGVRRVLTDDGTLWLNLGDSYNSGSHHNHGKGGNKEQPGLAPVDGWGKTNPYLKGLKHKDLIGIPWRVAFALQDDGWILRQDIIWHKPNPMPESVRDRCTKSHEYIFLFSKQPQYYFDQAAILEPFVTENGMGWGKTIDTHDSMKTDGDFTKQQSRKGQGMTAMKPHEGGRNKRSVWTVATQPYEGAHFAVFPAKLIEPCILAGSAVGDTVLDPFAGSGTTLQVAQRFGRKPLGIELNPEYIALIKQRLAQQAMVLV